MKTNFISIKKYGCPKDATSSDKMGVLLLHPQLIRSSDFPNEVLHCPTCDKLYRWQELREISITHSIGESNEG